MLRPALVLLSTLAFSALADVAPRELEITESVRGEVAYFGDANSLDQARENHATACDSWTKAVRATISSDLLYVDCGGRADGTLRTSYQYKELDEATNTLYWGTKYQDPFARVSSSEAKILVLSPKRVRTLNVAVRGESSTCDLTQKDSCFRARRDADASYATACEKWKAQAQKGMGNRFLLRQLLDGEKLRRRDQLPPVRLRL
jgi:hypothetical protein